MADQIEQIGNEAQRSSERLRQRQMGEKAGGIQAQPEKPLDATGEAHNLEMLRARLSHAEAEVERLRAQVREAEAEKVSARKREKALLELLEIERDEFERARMALQHPRGWRESFEEASLCGDVGGDGASPHDDVVVGDAAEAVDISDESATRPVVEGKDIKELVVGIVEGIIQKFIQKNQGSELPLTEGEMPTFTNAQGNENFLHIDTFISRLERAMPLKTWTDSQRVTGALRALKGEVLEHMRSLPESTRQSWGLFKQALRQRYTIPDTRLQQLKASYKPTRRATEDVLTFFYRVKEDLRNFDPSGCWTEGQRLTEFRNAVEGVVPSNAFALLYSMREDSDAALQHLAEALDRLEQNRRSTSYYGWPHAEGGSSYETAATGTRPKEGRKMDDNRPERIAPRRKRGGTGCYRCGSRSHSLWECGSPSPRCWRCYQLGHLANQCQWEPKNGPNDRGRDEFRGAVPMSDRSYNRQ